MAEAREKQDSNGARREVAGAKSRARPRARSPEPGAIAGSDATATPPLTKHQAFRILRVARSAIRGAPYNPRRIDKDAATKLEQSLRRRGLVETLVWNQRTGNLVGGHQRLSLLDAMEGSDAYSLDVAVVDLDEKAEKELNIALNNFSLQGSFDVDKLHELFSGQEVSLDGTGFDPMDLQVMFDDADLAPLFALDSAPDAVLDDVAALREVAALRQAERDASRGSDGTPPDASGSPGEAPEGSGEGGGGAPAASGRPKGSQAARGDIKQRWEQYKQDYADKTDTEHYAVVVFASREEQERFMKAIGRQADDRYVDGRVLFRSLGLPVSSDKAE
jgi:hypothetical protein